jgi:hypothetical protein
MENVIIKRTSDDGKETVGTIYVLDFTAYTLELPYKDNQHDISCIPTGTYRCKWTRSNRLSAVEGKDVFTYEIMNVPDRAGIRIHSANYFSQLLGCIALGDSLIDLNKDNEQDVANSRATIAKFNELMNKQDFLLTIENTFTA